MNAANQRRQMRHEGQADIVTGHARQTLADFRQMAMPRHRIGLEIVAGLGEQRVISALRPAPDTPDLQSATIQLVSITPASTNGMNPSCTAVG
jgi:hypothetical protein